MSKVLIVGDVHLSPRTPISRKDDYSETILNKIHTLGDIVIKYKVEHIIFLGDLFNTRHMTLPYFIKCFQEFKRLDSLGAKLHTVVGNHDIYYNNESTMEDSPMQILFDSQLFSNESFKDDNTYFTLVNYTTNTDSLPEVTEKNYYNVLVGHYFYKLGFGDTDHTITEEQASKLGYHSYWLGHDHTPYEPINNDHLNYSVHRPGSLSRGSSNTCQLHRNSIQLILFDSGTWDYEYINLPNVLSSKDVYKENLLISKVDMFSLDESLQDLLRSFEFDNSSDIIETLNQIEIDQEIKDKVLEYLSYEGVYQKEDTQ